MSSFIWQLFTCERHDEFATCNSCNQKIRRGKGKTANFSTTPLHNHAKARHEVLYNKTKASKKIPNEDQPSTSTAEMTAPPPKQRKLEALEESQKQITLEDAFEMKKLWDVNDTKSKRIHEDIMIMIAMDNEPFRMVERDGFIRLMARLNPRYVIPSRRYFSETMLPIVYNKVFKAVRNDLDPPNGCHVSFTSDIWTCSANNESFISLTGHWIMEDFTRRNAVLSARHFPSSHTGINVAEMLTEMWEQFDLKKHQRVLLLRDGATNMIAGGDLAGIPSIHCTLHRLQLVINDAIFSQRAVRDLLARCRRIATHFSHSPAAYGKLKTYEKEQGLPELKVVQDVPTRWNSSYLMIDRLVRIKRALQLYCIESPDLPNLTNNDWILCSSLLHILKPFFELTKEMSSEVSTLSSVIPNIVTLELFLSKMGEHDAGAQTTRNELLNSLRARFFNPSSLNIMSEKSYVIATIVDPRFKASFFKTNIIRDQAKTLLLNELQRLLERNEYEDSNQSISPESPQAKQQPASSDEYDSFFACFTEIASRIDCQPKEGKFENTFIIILTRNLIIND